MNALSRPPYYCLSHFPKVHNLARHWQMLREEYLQLPTNATEIHQIGKARIEFFVRFFATCAQEANNTTETQVVLSMGFKTKNGFDFESR